MGFYDRVSKTSLVYPSGLQTEADLRTEMIHTLDGYFPETEKGRYFLLRRIQLDSDGEKVACSCRDEGTGEPDRDNWCAICYGTGWLFNETYVKAYMTLVGAPDRSLVFSNTSLPPGLMDAPGYVFYFRYSDFIREDDQLIEIELDDDGDISVPVTRTKVFTISLVHGYRCDSGKMEFWKAFVHKNSVRYLNPPSYEGA